MTLRGCLKREEFLYANAPQGQGRLTGGPTPGESVTPHPSLSSTPEGWRPYLWCRVFLSPPAPAPFQGAWYPLFPCRWSYHRLLASRPFRGVPLSLRCASGNRLFRQSLRRFGLPSPSLQSKVHTMTARGDLARLNRESD